LKHLPWLLRESVT